MSDDPHDHEATTVLSEEDCWGLLGRNEFGHLAFHLAGEVGIAPLNYVISDGEVVFRTAEGSKLLGITMDQSVAFEVDEISEERATSVIVHGLARRLNEAEEDAADALPLRPWVGSLKYNVVAIQPTKVTGRSFRLVRG